ncbi:ATP-binding protein [Simplicispira psychrophila]|uniref:ATP-binding protein n=1 Tax=Simplicispira psychrophila TaxID=80882 RepID=UPI000AB58637|nr:ATP-binding protein [Simplicispira psychrophila]
MTPTAPQPAALARKKLPIGIQTFREIREDDCYYVDKTGMAVDLVQTGKAYFLSRPRRFGKSLFLDTLKELFEGNRALFTGLAAEPLWDWGTQHPVIRISFGAGVIASRHGLDQVLHQQLSHHETRWALPAAFPDARSRFLDLIERLHAHTGQRVVVLVDEYDKPILDNIDHRAVALEVREGLKDLYSVIKDSDAHIRFAFLTGVSKFSKVSLFSGLNNLTDITLDERYSALCGYTDADVDTVFAPELPGLDRQQIRDWYNGYNWLGTSVYNPFDVLLLFRSREFRPYWFETGTPTFLVKLLAERQFFTPDLARLQSSMALLSAFDVDCIEPEALLFQAGYLTVLERTQPIPGQWVYTLGYPNREVEASLNAALLGGLGAPERTSFEVRLRLIDLLKAGNLPGLKALFEAFFASIPHQWYARNPIDQYEGFYASVFYSYFAALGLDIRLEDSTNKGRIDMAVLFAAQVFVFEFKVVEANSNGSALQQIKDKGYADKYRALNQPIHLVGVEFSKASRNIVGFGAETLAIL